MKISLEDINIKIQLSFYTVIFFFCIMLVFLKGMSEEISLTKNDGIICGNSTNHFNKCLAKLDESSKVFLRNSEFPYTESDIINYCK